MKILLTVLIFFNFFPNYGFEKSKPLLVDKSQIQRIFHETIDKKSSYIGLLSNGNLIIATKITNNIDVYHSEFNCIIYDLFGPSRSIESPKDYFDMLQAIHEIRS